MTPTASDRLPEETVRTTLQTAAWEKRRAIKNYRSAVEMAHEQGWAHTDIARACGVTEAAVRNYLRRKGYKGTRTR